MRGLKFAIGSAFAAGVLLSGGVAHAGIDPTVGAVDDAYATPFQTAIVLDTPAPSDNDVAPEDADGIDTEILTEPANGTLSAPTGDPVDGVTYTPDAGFTGTDSFEYAFYWFFDFTEESFAPADLGEYECAEFGAGVVCASEATVFIEVGAPAPSTTVPPTTVTVATVPPTTPTTVAAAAQLPATGANGQLLAIGLGVAALGLSALLLSRRA